MKNRDWKIVAGTATVIGIIISILEAVYSPVYIVDADSPNFPGWIGWVRLLMTSLAPLVYIAIDFFDKKIFAKIWLKMNVENRVKEGRGV